MYNFAFNDNTRRAIQLYRRGFPGGGDLLWFCGGGQSLRGNRRYRYGLHGAGRNGLWDGGVAFGQHTRVGYRCGSGGLCRYKLIGGRSRDSSGGSGFFSVIATRHQIGHQTSEKSFGRFSIGLCWHLACTGIGGSDSGSRWCDGVRGKYNHLPWGGNLLHFVNVGDVDFEGLALGRRRQSIQRHGNHVGNGNEIFFFETQCRTVRFIELTRQIVGILSIRGVLGDRKRRWWVCSGGINETLTRQQTKQGYA